MRLGERNLEFVANKEFTMRVLSHYKAKLQNFQEQKDVKPFATSAILEKAKLGDVLKKVVEVSSWASKDNDDNDMKVIEAGFYAEILDAALRLYVADCEVLAGKLKAVLPNTEMLDYADELRLAKSFLPT